MNNSIKSKTKKVEIYQNVDVSTSVESVRKSLSGPAEEEAGDALLHVLEPEDGRSDRPERERGTIKTKGKYCFIANVSFKIKLFLVMNVRDNSKRGIYGKTISQSGVLHLTIKY